MPERIIRAARQSDAAAIVELLAELGFPTTAPEAELRLRRSLSGDHGGVLVLEIEGRVVGLASYQLFSLIYRSQPQCRITALVVLSEVRRRGLARALVGAIEARAREAGCFRLELTTRPGRSGALPFYSALGFEERPHRLVKHLD